MINFDTIKYLSTGNPRQKAAYTILKKHKIMDTLKPFSAIVTGTIPIEIDIPGSDIDIACYWREKSHFLEVLNLFSHYDDFTLVDAILNGHETVTANFIIESQPFEIFGQNRPVHEQESYRHMIVEHQILQSRPLSFRQQVIELKKRGLKTESAFGKQLGLNHDPYSELLEYTTS